MLVNVLLPVVSAKNLALCSYISEFLFYFEFLNGVNYIGYFIYLKTPFNTYADSSAILLSQIILVILLWYYEDKIPLIRKIVLGVFFTLLIALMFFNCC